MALPIPNLDDRTFQDLVDDAKRMLQQKWPDWTGWTDHNVSDPGVTLIESVAFIVDQLIYRLNRVPDNLHLRLMELIGVQLRAPTAATAPVTFWLTAPRDHTVVVPRGTEVATERTATDEAIVFTTDTPLDIVSCTVTAIGRQASGGVYEDLPLPRGESHDDTALFSTVPRPGDAFYVGLSGAAPSCVVALRFGGDVQGTGIDPRNPPRRWEAWTGRSYVPCEIERDETGGFNRRGDVVLHLPADHATASLADRQAGWVRCVVLPSDRPYTASPSVRQIEGFVIGGTVRARHALTIRNEDLGLSEGVSGQSYPLRHHPLVDDGRAIEVHAEGDEHPWTTVEQFAASGPGDRHIVIDRVAGLVRFGPAVRDADGTQRHFGAIPPAGQRLRIASYQTGGGASGNVGVRSLVVVRSSIPHVKATCENRDPARGGTDGETVDQARLRAPLALWSRDRAVTLDDYEALTQRASPEVARCTAMVDANGQVVVAIVPWAEVRSQDERYHWQDLQPNDALVATVREHLAERRCVGTHVEVRAAEFVALSVEADIRLERRADPTQTQRRVLDALNDYLDPYCGGVDGAGWPFGRNVETSELFAVVARVPGVDAVARIRLGTPAEVRDPQLDTAGLRSVHLGDDCLALPIANRVRVV